MQEIASFLHSKGIDIWKDLIVPSLTPDKIIGLISLLFLIRGFYLSNRLNRLNLLSQLNSSHREIWTKIVEIGLHDKLNDPQKANNLSSEEYRYTLFLVLHVYSAYEAHKLKVRRLDKGEINDIREMLAMPVVKAVWENIKKYQSKQFVEFIEGQMDSNKKVDIKKYRLFELVSIKSIKSAGRFFLFKKEKSIKKKKSNEK